MTALVPVQEESIIMIQKMNTNVVEKPNVTTLLLVLDMKLEIMCLISLVGPNAKEAVK